MSDIAISILMPCYNAERTVAEAIASVLAQTVPVAEIVAVDDGSTDRTYDVLSNLARIHSGVITLVRQTHGGIANARTAALRAARSPWVLPVDADDRLLPEALRLLTEYVLDHPHVAVVYGDYRLMDSGGTPGEVVSISSRRIDPLDGAILATVMWENVASATSLIRRSDALAADGYDLFSAEAGREVDGFEDVYLWLRLLAQGAHFGYLAQPLYEYRVHPGSLSNDTSRVRAAKVASFAGLFSHFPGPAAEAFVAMIQRRAEQLRDAFETIVVRDRQVESLLREIDLAREFQDGQEKTIESLRSLLEERSRD